MLCPTHLRVWLTLGLRLVTVTLALLSPRLWAEAGLAEALVTGRRLPPLQGSVAGTHPLAEHSTIVRKFISKLRPHPAALRLGSLYTSRSPGPPPGDRYHVVINILYCVSTCYIYFISTYLPGDRSHSWRTSPSGGDHQVQARRRSLGSSQ